MKGYKGFDKNLQCRGKQYEVGQTYKENEAILCEKGLHFCELPHDVFAYYGAGDSRFAEIEAEEVSDNTDSDSKLVCKKITVKVEISVFDICKIAVNAFFEKFGFDEKIKNRRDIL